MSQAAVQERRVVLDDILDLVETLSPEEQEVLATVIRNRLREYRRARLIADAQEAHEAYDRGDVVRGTVDELMAEINRCVSS